MIVRLRARVPDRKTQSQMLIVLFHSSIMSFKKAFNAEEPGALVCLTDKRGGVVGEM